MRIAQMMEAEGYRSSGVTLSGLGGVETGADAAEFLLLGSNTVQVGGCCVTDQHRCVTDQHRVPYRDVAMQVLPSHKVLLAS